MTKFFTKRRKRELLVIEEKAFISEAQERFAHIIEYNAHLPDDLIRDFKLAEKIAENYNVTLDSMDRLESNQESAEKSLIFGAVCIATSSCLLLFASYKLVQKKKELEEKEVL